MIKVYFKLRNSFITKIDKGVFCDMEKYLIESGEASDKDGFDVIRQRLINPPKLSADEFAFEVIYVILASGFRQKIAKQKFLIISEFLKNGGEAIASNLLSFFGNKNKINAISKVWNKRDEFRDGFYELKDLEDKMLYLKNLPYIGEITKNHIARNLGINDVKYDVWIRRLGMALNGKICDTSSCLSVDEKNMCDEMFQNISFLTGMPIGYVDVVLWKACQIGVLEFRES